MQISCPNIFYVCLSLIPIELSPGNGNSQKWINSLFNVVLLDCLRPLWRNGRAQFQPRKTLNRSFSPRNSCNTLWFYTAIRIRYFHSVHKIFKFSESQKVQANSNEWLELLLRCNLVSIAEWERANLMQIRVQSCRGKRRNDRTYWCCKHVIHQQFLHCRHQTQPLNPWLRLLDDHVLAVDAVPSDWALVSIWVLIFPLQHITQYTNGSLSIIPVQPNDLFPILRTLIRNWAI